MYALLLTLLGCTVSLGPPQPPLTVENAVPDVQRTRYVVIITSSAPAEAESIHEGIRPRLAQLDVPLVYEFERVELTEHIWNADPDVRAWAHVQATDSEIRLIITDEEAGMFERNVFDRQETLSDLEFSEIEEIIDSRFSVISTGGWIGMPVVDRNTPEPETETALHVETEEAHVTQVPPSAGSSGVPIDETRADETRADAIVPPHMAITAGYGFSAVTSDLFLHGPHTELLLGGEVLPGTELSAILGGQAYARSTTPGAEGSVITFWGGNVKAGLALSWAPGQPAWSLGVRAGLMLDLLRHEPVALPSNATFDPELNPVLPMLAARVAAGVVYRWRPSQRNELRVSALASLAMAANQHYTLTGGGGAEDLRLLSMWNLRPGLSVSVGWGHHARTRGAE